MDLAKSLIERGPYTLIDFHEANRAWANFRFANPHGNKPSYTSPKLFTDPAHNAKFAKTLANKEVFVYGLALAQAESSLLVNACRFSTPVCRAACVSTAGRGSYSTVQNGRIRRTLFLYENPAAFLTLMSHEIEKIWEKHGTAGRVRLNTFSDIPWENVHPALFSRFPRLKFYDYTKWPLARRATPKNYTLCFSASERTKDVDIVKLVKSGTNVAVVFDVRRSQPLPARWKGCRVIDGDKNDDRSGDPKGVVVGLRSKGKMRKKGGKMPRKVA